MQMDETEQAVMKVLSGSDPAYYTHEIVEALRYTEKEVINALWKMSKRGMVNMDAPISVPESWALLRIQGRMHHEVVSHISLDDGGTLLCGASPAGMEYDDAPTIIPFAGITYDYYGNRPVVHALCKRCCRKIVQATE